MPLPPPEEQYQWIHVPAHGSLELVVVGEIQAWYVHWLRPAGVRRPVPIRCCYAEVQRCAYCTRGYERRIRYVMPVSQEGAVRLLELGSPQYPSLLWIRNRTPWVGVRIRVSRERPTANGAIRVEMVAAEPEPITDEIDLYAYVQRLGIDGLRRYPIPPEDLLDEGAPQRRYPAR